ncbi:hypothetical protein PHISCL_06545 [Aspergillus sclerotialis]|uniref:Uncharacterized protein n=1 Tax=Aspergillus sclerotialis TaxID=2070753 RepID=A0A3A2ZVR4_9EURO|nr:hypothetical protein PHISCL_06545 [Aspergillus sclerotialis]
MDHTETGKPQDGGSTQSRESATLAKIEALTNTFFQLLELYKTVIQEILENPASVDARLRLDSIRARVCHESGQFHQDLRILYQELEQVIRAVKTEDMVFVCQNGVDAVSDASLYTSGKLETEKFLTDVYGLSKDQILQLDQSNDNQSIKVLNAMATAVKFDATSQSSRCPTCFQTFSIVVHLRNGPVDDIPSVCEARDRFWELYNARD